MDVIKPLRNDSIQPEGKILSTLIRNEDDIRTNTTYHNNPPITIHAYIHRNLSCRSDLTDLLRPDMTRRPSLLFVGREKKK